MVSGLLRVAIVGSCVAGLGGGPALAQTVLEKAARDEVARVKTGDPEMAAAIAKARNGLSEFLEIADDPAPDQDHFAVKVGAPLSDGGHEYLWITPFTHDGDKFVGRVANSPRNFTNLKLGDRLAFARKDIADWKYRDGGRERGNYTACVLLRRESAEQRRAFKARYGLDCEE